VKLRTRALAAELASRRPDLLVVVAFGRILSRRVLDVARLGAVNVHFSLLPELRGAAPVQWALARGYETTGVTTMLMNEKMDEGDLLLQRKIDVNPGEHAPSLGRRLARVGCDLLIETLDGLEAGTLRPRAQDHSVATLAPLLSREDGQVDPSATAEEIAGRVRGFDPWPGVWLLRADRRIRIVEVAPSPGTDPDARPGTLTGITDDGIVMACGGGSRLLLVEVQPEGRKRMRALDAVNGRQLSVGDRLEPVTQTG
jgi:methionyl-tRNA formyltransferase